MVELEFSRLTRSINRDLSYLFIINITHGISIQLINPLFPLFLEQIGANSTQNATVISLASLIATSLMLPSGILLDKIGKRNLLIASSVACSLSIFLIMYTRSWTQVTPLYILFSAGGALFVPTKMSMITEYSEPQIRGTIFGLMNMA